MSPRKRDDGKTCGILLPGTKGKRTYCPNAYFALGMCRLHYDRHRKHGDPHHLTPRGGKPKLPVELQHISRHKLNRWVNQGYLVAPKTDNPFKREWAAGEIRVAVNMHKLVTTLGMKPSKAAEVARLMAAGKSLTSALKAVA